MHPVDVRWLPRGRDERLEPAIGARRPPGPARGGRRRARVPARHRRDLAASPTRSPASSARDVDVHRLAGALALEEQDRALAPSPPGRRRVVLATDIAETSLTVDGVRVVVDSGLARAPRFDAGTGHDPADDGVDQPRLGRPARRPGRAHRARRRLPAVEQGRARHPAGPPGGRDHPGRPRRARARARRVGHAGRAAVVRRPAAGQGPPPGRRAARRRSARSTATAPSPPLGRRMVGLPVHPRLARMVVGRPDALSCVVAAVVDERDVLRGRTRPSCPPTSRCASRVVVRARRRRPRRPPGRRPGPRAGRRHRPAGRDPLRRRRRRPRRRRRGAARRVPRPARRRGAGRASSSCATAPGAWVADDDPLATAPFVVAADLDGKRSGARIRLGAAVDAATIAALLDGVVEDRRLEWDADADDLVERVERRLDALRLGEERRRPAPGEATTGGARRPGAGDAGSPCCRGRRRRRSCGPGWRSCAATLGDAVARPVRPRRCWRRSTSGWRRTSPAPPGAADLDRLDLGVLLRSQLPWPLGADLDELAPRDVDAADRPGGADRLRRRAADGVGARAGRVRRDRRTRPSPAAGCR